MLPGYRFDITTEVESRSHAVPGVHLNKVRTGAGIGPHSARLLEFDDATICVSSVGFPVRSQLTMPDDCVLAVTAVSAPPGTRWCGYDLEPGDTLLYAPGAEHTSISPVGVESTSVVVRIPNLEETADELQMHLRQPPRGSVRRLQPAWSSRSITSLLEGVGFAPADNEDLPTLLRDVRHALASELSEEADRHRPERTSVRESRRIVRSCLEFVNDAGGRPSIAELCRVAFVSERRLRNAFVDAFGVPPMTYFRDQKLNEARTRLLATSNRQTVMEISIDVGIENGGRFAHRYFELFGELPSTTLYTAS